VRHTGYVLSLLNSYHLNQDLLEAALFYADHRKISGMLQNIYPDPGIKDDRRNYDNYDNCIEGNSDIDDLARYLFDDLAKGYLTVNEKQLIAMLKTMLKEKLKKMPAKLNDELEARVTELSAVFRFTTSEIDLLTALYSVFEVQTDMMKDMLNKLEFSGFIRFMSVITGTGLREMKLMLSKGGSLYRSGILTNISHNGRQFIDIEERISEYLSGIGDISLTERFIRKDRKQSLPLEYFDLPEESMTAIMALLNDDKPCNILLAGVAGTGKTEFARSAARAAGKPVFTLNVGGTDRNKVMSLKHDEENAVYVSFRAAEELVKTAGGILIADEMDVVLNWSEKGWLNLFLDSSTAKIIWITNNIRMVEESTMRRFQYVRYFEKLTSKERVKIWHNILTSSPFKEILADEDIQALAREHPVNAGGIAHALSTLERLINIEEASKERIVAGLNHLLECHRQQISKEFNRKKNSLNRIEKTYDVSVLNTTADPAAVTEAVSDFASLLMAGKIKEGNMNLLFAGVPGTGKTEFVKHLAKSSGLELIVKRCSDLVSKWVGETEKNIADAFREAEAEKAILFIDEADSLFTDRENSRASWETSRTNELLTQMENFTGILICATNQLSEIDGAAMRRFQWKITFKPLKPKKRGDLYTKFFSFIKTPLTADCLNRVRAIEGLTPGDMKAVREQFKGRDGITHEKIIAALEAEQTYKRGVPANAIGF
jgi:SpoVK/Ycf46/Vps4 family AAA+-type ATPase